MSTEYARGNIGRMVGFLSQEYGFDVHEAAAKMKIFFPELRDPSLCGNCGASMEVRECKLDYLDARLLLEMGKVVKKNLISGMPFNDANRVHVQSIGSLTYAERSRTTQSSKLGLITHISSIDRKGPEDKRSWLITKRGFAFLRNEEVPKRVAVWRNEIQDRFPERITIGEILTEGYVPGEWRDMGNIIQGALL